MILIFVHAERNENETMCYFMLLRLLWEMNTYFFFIFAIFLLGKNK